MEKLKLLICDDEQNIRQGLKCILDWESLGYKVCAEASNGKDAVNQIIDLRPDLVILDIKMPGMTGIEVISEIKKYCSENKVNFPAFIILSGFSEFEYAQKTINYGAKAYLLKPVDEDQLQEKVIEIAKEINQNKIREQGTEEVSELYSKKFLLRLLTDSKNDFTELSLPSDDFYSDCESSVYQSIIVFPEYCKKYNYSQFEKSLDNYFSFFKNKIIKIENELLIVVKTKNQDAVEKCIERAAKLNPENTFITSGNPETGLQGIKKSYQTAKSLYANLFFQNNVACITQKNMLKAENSFDKNTEKQILDSFIFSIETYDKDLLESNCEKLQNLLILLENSVSIKQELIFCIIEIKNILKLKYPERDFTESIPEDLKEKIVSNILSGLTFSEIFKYFHQMVFELLENFNFNTADSVIVKVIAYVKSNYNQDLKLESLGELFNCNSAYLGKKFKKYTNVQFNTYLDNIRIEAAKDKLKNSDLKIYQISKIVGYTNTDYFFMKFKKSTGITPKEFRRQIGKETD